VQPGNLAAGRPRTGHLYHHQCGDRGRCLAGCQRIFPGVQLLGRESKGWAWAFLVATDNGNGTGTMLKADFVNGTFATQALAASATGIQTFDYLTLLPSTSTAGFTDA
jgi:hypothetical protein